MDNPVITTTNNKSFSDIFPKREHLFELSLDIFLHCSILFIFLSIFFLFYISKTETTVMENELGGKLDFVFDTVKKVPMYGTIKNKYNDKINEKMNEYKNVAEDVKENNDKIRSRLYTVIGILGGFILLIGLYGFFSKSNGHIIKEIFAANVIIFAFVGMTEFGFFKLIAMNYVPSPPSLMLTSIKQDIINNPKFN